MSKLTFGPYSFDISNENKVLLPDNITKIDIINYYDKISSYMLPYMKNRPIMMQRLPNGLEGETFYQKNRGSYFPEWIRSEEIKIVSTVTDYVLCQNKATLVYLANQACLSFHTWLSTYPNIQRPDKLILDLDPGTDNFEPVRATAFHVKAILEEHNLRPFVMTTGSKGVHIIVHLKGSSTYEDTKSFAKSLGAYLVQKFPNDLTIELNKVKRGNRLFIDYLRNELGATSVAPYSMRALKNGPIATPISWEELSNKNLTSQFFNLSNIFERLLSLSENDPFKNYKITTNILPKFKY